MPCPSYQVLFRGKDTILVFISQHQVLHRKMAPCTPRSRFLSSCDATSSSTSHLLQTSSCLNGFNFTQATPALSAKLLLLTQHEPPGCPRVPNHLPLSTRELVTAWPLMAEGTLERGDGSIREDIDV